MLTIDCPWCGPRDEVEFVNGGDHGLVRPGDGDDPAFADYAFYRTNPRGLLAERWFHQFGCRRWFVAVRDTASHRIAGTRPPDPAQ